MASINNNVSNININNNINQIIITQNNCSFFKLLYIAIFTHFDLIDSEIKCISVD